MPSRKAILMLDPDRREEQLAFITERIADLYELGDFFWVALTDEQAARFAQQGITVQFQEAADWVELPAISFNPAEAEPNPPAALAATLPTGDEKAYCLVQFFAPPEVEWVSEIEAIGGNFVQDVPTHVAIFRLTSDQITEVRSLTFVNWVGLYHPAYALSYELAGQSEPFTATTLADLRVDPAQVVQTDTGTVEILLFADVSTERVRSPLESTDATVITDTGYSLVVNVTAERIPALAKIEGVRVIDLYRPAQLGNHRAGIIIAANQVRNQGMVPASSGTDFLINLDGAGEIVSIIDSGLDGGAPPVAMHPDLAGRVLQVNNLNDNPAAVPPLVLPTADNTPHGTHVAGSIAGNGSQSGGSIRGMAPACQIIFNATNQPTVASPNALNFNNFLRGLVNAHRDGARVHSNSWGNVGITSNVYTNNVSAVLDRFAFFHPDSLVVFLAHNFEADANNNGILDMNHLPAQATAKNVLCIGACENETNTDGILATYRNLFAGRYNATAFDVLADLPPVAGDFPLSDSADEIALFSNRGRVADAGVPANRRRIKPDLVTPGTNIISIGPQAMLPFPAGDNRRPNSAPANFYYVSSGTSMATPIAAGAAVLTRQFYRSRFDQLRRPLLLERLEQLGDRLLITSHRTGLVLGWIRRDTGTNQNHLVAAIYSQSGTRRGESALMRQADIVQLQTNVGDHPMPLLGWQGENTLLLHRAADNTLRLSCYNLALAPVNSFGTNGSVTLAPASRPEETRPPAFCVRTDEVAVVWHQTGTDNLVFQRYRTDTGVAIASLLTLGTATATSPHSYVVHTGTHYAILWVLQDGSNYKLQMRRVDSAGNLVGTQPTTLLTQPQEIRHPHLCWNPWIQQFLVVWVNVTGTPTGDELNRMVVNADLTIAQAATVITPPVTLIPGGPAPLPPKGIRRPQVAMHPNGLTGFTLVWEDDTYLVQDAGVWQSRFDVYLTFLNVSGNLDGRITGDRLRISDTPNHTGGFAALTTSEGNFLTWQSDDEINSDVLGVYALKVTGRGAFQAQSDPNTPLLDSGRYVRHLLHQHNQTSLTATAMVWAGGDYFLLRPVFDGIGSRLHLVHTNSDGRPDEAFGTDGARELDLDIGYDRLAFYWAETRLIVAHGLGPSTKVFLLDNAGTPIANFGTNGSRAINETAAAANISPQLGHTGSGNSFRVVMAYGRSDAPPHDTLRYVVLDQTGNTVTGPLTLAPADGTARQGWFHLVRSDQPVHAIATWHIQDGGNLQVRINRFRVNGTAQHATPIRLTTLVGNSQNAVLAPRPQLFEMEMATTPTSAQRRRRREYGIAWEYRPNPANPGDPVPPSEIRFSRLNRDGTVAAVRDVQVVHDAAQNASQPQLVWHFDGYGLAWLEQPTAGGNHQLKFAILDQNGGLVNLAPPSSPIYPVSDPNADVQQFHLVWNGRSFRMIWTEIVGGELRQMQTAIALPRQAGLVGYDRPYHHPSAALIRATLINGATNIRRTALPNLSNDPSDGYGWGRINLRQSLAPSPPVTCYVRDDSAVASGCTVRYDFYLPPNTRLLRATLNWTDPPGNRLVNNLNLRIITPASGANPSRTYVGNRWQPAPNAQLSDPLPTPPPADPFDPVHSTEQIVIQDPPPGTYIVEVIGGRFSSSEFQQFAGQPFALMFVGSGLEVRFGGISPAAAAGVY